MIHHKRGHDKYAQHVALFAELKEHGGLEFATNHMRIARDRGEITEAEFQKITAGK